MGVFYNSMGQPEGDCAMARFKRSGIPAYVPWLFILPSLTFYVIFKAIPIFSTFVISLYQWEGISFATMDFIGIQNYVGLFRDEIFSKALWNNMLFIGMGASIVTVFSLFIAVLLERSLPLSNFFRGTFFIPAVMSMVVIGIVFTLFLNPQLGMVNPFLKLIGLGSLTRDWLGDPQLALPTVILSHVWQMFGFYMFIFIAGLKSIPDELYEAAHIDGASAWQDFWYVTLPILKPVTVVVVILATINTLKTFDLVYVMTFGGPNYASQVLTLWMYLQGFMYNHMGYGSAVAVALLLITFAFSAVQLKVTGSLK